MSADLADLYLPFTPVLFDNMIEEQLYPLTDLITSDVMNLWDNTDLGDYLRIYTPENKAKIKSTEHP